LLTRIIDQCRRDPTLRHVCLHVHTANAPALAFYATHGFSVHAMVHNYYARDFVDPPDAFLLKLPVHGGPIPVIVDRRA
jgi:ribosomal protein S18 acetylase RimI-like enzyme